MSFDFYAINQKKGYPGMKADATVDVIDTFASEGGVNPGELVYRGTNPDEQVKAVATAGNVSNAIGIAVHTHKSPASGAKYYEDGYPVPVMTFGDVYVEVGGSVTAGGAVAVTVGESGPAFTAAGEGATSVTGMTYLESGVEGDIVAVRIRK